MRGPGRRYNQLQEVKEAQIYILSNECRNGHNTDGGWDTPTGQNSFAYQETRIILFYYLQSIIYRVRKQFTGSERLEPNTWKGML